MFANGLFWTGLFWPAVKEKLVELGVKLCDCGCGAEAGGNDDEIGLLEPFV